MNGRRAAPIARLATVLALSAACFAVYAPVRHHELVDWDDFLYLRDNPLVTGGLSWDAVVAAFTTPVHAYWIPLTWISFQAGHSLHGLDAGAILLTNVALHAVATVLLFAALARMTGAVGVAAFTAAVFALHPLHVESVAWASERKDVLSAALAMGALLAYARHVESPSPRRFTAVVALYGAALLAKPAVFTFPFWLLLLDAWPLRRRAWLEKAPLFALGIAAGVVLLRTQAAGGGLSFGAELPLAVRLANALDSTLWYVAKTLWPANLAALHPHPKALPPLAEIAAAALLFALLSAAALAAWRRRPWWTIGWLWFLVTLAPTLGIVQAGAQARADRFTYVPMIGLALAAGFELRALAAARPARRAAIALAACGALALLGVAARAQVATWRDTVTLFSHAARVTERNGYAHHRLAEAERARGRMDEAEAHYRAAIRATPDFAPPHGQLGVVQERSGRREEAIRSYRRAAELAPENALFAENLGFALLRAGRWDEAGDALLRAAQLSRRSFPLQRAAVQALTRANRLAEAIAPARAAVALAPHDALAANDLARLLAQVRDPALRDPFRAVELARAAIARGAPTVLWDTLALGYAEAGRCPEARAAAARGEALARARGEAALAERIRARTQEPGFACSAALPG